MQSFDYDMFVIGSGPAGQRAAIQAAKLSKRVGIAERSAVLGGMCINTGAIPSKTLREAVLYLSGYREHALYGDSYAVKQEITMSDLLFRADHVIKREIDVTRHQLTRNRVEVVTAEASFVDPHTIRLAQPNGGGSRDITAASIVVATGTTATKTEQIPFDERRIFTSDEVLQLDRLPRTLTVVGAGVIGVEYACVLVLSQLGFGNCLRKRLRLLPFFRSVDVGGWQPWDENGMWSGWKGKNETSWND